MRKSVRLARAAVLLATAVVLAKLLVTSQIHYFLSPSFDWLSGLTGLVLAAMALAELAHIRSDGAQPGLELENAVTLGLVALPLAAALLLTPHALGASNLGGQSLRRIVLAFDGPATRSSSAPPSPRAPIADVGDLVSYLHTAGESGVGQHVHARGLVARSDGLDANEFVLVRYAIVHCIADAQPLGLLVIAPGSVDFASDQWVEIDGTLDSAERSGARLVTVQAESVRPTEEPTEPYILAF